MQLYTIGINVLNKKENLLPIIEDLRIATILDIPKPLTQNRALSQQSLKHNFGNDARKKGGEKKKGRKQQKNKGQSPVSYFVSDPKHNAHLSNDAITHSFPPPNTLQCPVLLIG